MPTDDDTLIPLVQAAQHLGMANSAAYSRVRLGRLHAVLVKNKLMVRVPRSSDTEKKLSPGLRTIGVVAESRRS